MSINKRQLRSLTTGSILVNNIITTLLSSFIYFFFLILSLTLVTGSCGFHLCLCLKGFMLLLLNLALWQDVIEIMKESLYDKYVDEYGFVDFARSGGMSRQKAAKKLLSALYQESESERKDCFSRTVSDRVIMSLQVSFSVWFLVLLSLEENCFYCIKTMYKERIV